MTGTRPMLNTGLRTGGLRVGGSTLQTSSGDAPDTAKYILQQANTTLTGAQSLGALATGILKSTTTTGVVSIATAGTDYVAPEVLTVGTIYGPTVSGGIIASASLLLRSTLHATKGIVKIGGTAANDPGITVDEVNNRVGINKLAPSTTLHVVGACTLTGAVGITGVTTLTGNTGVTGNLSSTAGTFVATLDGVPDATMAVLNSTVTGQISFKQDGLYVNYNVTRASGASISFDAFDFDTGTLTLTGNTSVTSLLAGMVIDGPIITSGSALTVTDAATLQIWSKPSAAGSTTLTNAWAMHVRDGAVRLDGRMVESKGADVASASTLTLGADGNTFAITGTTTVNYITTTGWRSGSRVMLVLPASLTLTSGATSVPANTAALTLAGGQNIVTPSTGTAMTITLVYDGTVWQETSRRTAVAYANARSEYYKARAAKLLGINPVKDYSWSFDPLMLSNTGLGLDPVGYTFGTTNGGTRSMFFAGGNGGVVRNKTNATANAVSEHYTQTNIIGVANTSVWYVVVKGTITTTPDAQTTATWGLFPFTGLNCIGVGVWGNSSTVNFGFMHDGSIATAGGTFKSLGVAIDTAAHVFELYCLGDGVLRARIDEGAEVSEAMTLTHQDLCIFRTVRNKTTAADQTILTNFVGHMCV